MRVRLAKNLKSPFSSGRKSREESKIQRVLAKHKEMLRKIKLNEAKIREIESPARCALDGRIEGRFPGWRAACYPSSRDME
jgi:hypothetical protein